MLCRTILRLALPVPVSVPASVVPVPNLIGLGAAASEMPRPCRLVVNVRRLPRVVPDAFWATIR